MTPDMDKLVWEPVVVILLLGLFAFLLVACWPKGGRK